jgi:uncharacterized protein (TIGR02300 family)
VANPALGTKRICTGCEAKFYDLGKTPIVCPACETVFVVAKAAPLRARSAFDPRNAPARHMGVLKEAEAPALAADAKEEEDAAEEAVEIEATEATGEADEAGGVPMLEELDEK